MPSHAPPVELRRLADGTPYFAPLGELVRDLEDDRVQCHLCGGWYQFVGGSHLIRTHGWALEAYREAFQLRESIRTCSRLFSAQMRDHARRLIDAGEFSPEFLPDPAEARAQAKRGAPTWRSLAARHPELIA